VVRADVPPWTTPADGQRSRTFVTVARRSRSSIRTPASPVRTSRDSARDAVNPRSFPGRARRGSGSGRAREPLLVARGSWSAPRSPHLRRPQPARACAAPGVPATFGSPARCSVLRGKAPAASAWIHRPDCSRECVVTAEVPFDLGGCGLLKLATPGSRGHLWDAIVAHRGQDPRKVR
jgi:hypothetical protein